MGRDWDRGFLKDWDDLTWSILASTADASRTAGRGRWAGYKQRFDAAVSRVAQAGLDDEWNADVREAMNASFSWRQVGIVSAWDDAVVPRHADFMRAFRMAYALRGRHAAMVTPEEGAFLRKALMRSATAFLPESPVPPSPLPTRGTFHVEVAIPWHQLRRGARKFARSVRTDASVTVDTVDPSDAPVAWRLKAGDGSGWLDVRSCDGALFRPVLAPETWRPVVATEFARAASGAVAWQDNPFVRSTGPGRSAMAPLEYAAPHDPRGDDPSTAVERAIVCAGRLICVQGVVYRSTKEPVLRLAWLLDKGTSRGQAFVAAWDLGDLTSLDDQRTMLDPEGGYGMERSFGLDGSHGRMLDYVGLGTAGDAWTDSYERAGPIAERLAGRPAEPVGEATRALGLMLASLDAEHMDPSDVETVREALRFEPFKEAWQVARSLADAVTFARRGTFEHEDDDEAGIAASMKF